MKLEADTFREDTLEFSDETSLRARLGRLLRAGAVALSVTGAAVLPTHEADAQEKRTEQYQLNGIIGGGEALRRDGQQGMRESEFREVTARRSSIEHYMNWYKQEYLKQGVRINDTVARQLAEKALVEDLKR